MASIAEWDPHGRRFLLLFGLFFITLFSGISMKTPCAMNSWADNYPFKQHCYSDIFPLYGIRGLEHHRIPYVEEFSEYPALTGLLNYGLSFFSEDSNSFFYVHAFVLSLLATLVTWVFYQMRMGVTAALPWIAAPSIVLHGFTNYEMLPLACVALAFYTYHRGALAWSGFWLGLGAAAKLFPLFILPAFLLALYNRSRRLGFNWRSAPALRSPTRYGLGFLAGALPVNLILIALNKDLWWKTWAFHKDRGTTYETIWFYVNDRYYSPRGIPGLTDPEITKYSLYLFAGLTAFILLIGLWRRSTSVAALSVAIMGVYLATAKVYSSQHVLWILPMVAFAGRLLWPWVALQVADILSYYYLYEIFSLPQGTSLEAFRDVLHPLEFWVLVKVACFLLLALVAVWNAGWRERPETAPGFEASRSRERPLRANAATTIP